MPTFEWIVGILFSVVTAAFWRWADKLGKNDDEIHKRLETIVRQIHEVEKTYQSKADAKHESSEIKALLKEIRAELKEVSSKIDKKADKSC
ncbi:hypothetical protein MIS45_11115 [Wielerella bovis]|uniref:hypothetical protein n=1 Tax=Wielerella bovis TaxID=2917790 RepID=UPI002018E48A|nr:hypothetical protein [Wielerella bovis]ULJ69271.1 hypothetical protein MIS45_11115 [Wielerella bovis]